MRERARTRYGATRTAAEIRERQVALDRELGDAPDSIWAMREELKRSGGITALMVAVNQE